MTADRCESEPSEAELVAFATRLLVEHGDAFSDEKFVIEAVRENRDLWVMLYDITRDVAAGSS